MKAGTSTALAALVALACFAPSANASPPLPTGLTLAGGFGWRANEGFTLSWSAPPPSDPPLTAAHYRVLSPQGAVLEEGRSRMPVTGFDGLFAGRNAPAGIYRAEIWFEDTAGKQGPAASVPLPFDKTRPGAPTPGPVPNWIGRTAMPLRVHIGHPAAPLPLSGIHGYAAAIDDKPSGSPCARPDRCTETETTLHGGIGDDELAIPTLPEGTSYLHVVAVSGSGMKSPTSGRAVLHVDLTDPVTRLAGAPVGWTNRAVELSASANDDTSGMAPSGDGPAPFTAIRVDDGVPATAFGQQVETSVIAEGVHRVAYFARDAAGNVNDGALDNGVQNRAPAVAWVRIDRTPPDLAFANSQTPLDPDLIRVRVVDRLSGPDLARGWIGVRRAGSNDRFERLPAQPAASGELRARWESDARSNGRYEFRAVGYDAAGNLAVTSRRANGAPMVLTNPLKATTTLRDAFDRGQSSLIVPYGRGVRLRGRLTTGLSTALSGVPVRVVERFAAGAHPAVRVSIVDTGPAGTFSMRAPPGPSRTIELAFDGSPTLARSSGRELELRVRGGVRLGASADSARVGGRPVVFTGRVLAAAGTIPAGGVPVQLQFRLGRSPWSAFRTIQTDGSGRFRYTYRFSDDDSRGARFQFRAYLPAHDGWPYEAAASRPVIVRGY